MCWLTLHSPLAQASNTWSQYKEQSLAACEVSIAWSNEHFAPNVYTCVDKSLGPPLLQCYYVYESRVPGYASWTNQTFCWRVAAPPPPPPPPPGPPDGCASGEGGFYTCPGNSPPGGSPTGPEQNAGQPQAASDDDSASESSEAFDYSLGGASQTCKPADAVGDPILAGTGNVFHSELDYAGPGPRLVRSYNSATSSWVHNHMMRVIANATLANVVRPDGKILTFTGSGLGAWTSNATVVARLHKLDPSSGAAWRFTSDDDSVELYDAAGMPISVTPRHGRTTRYETASNRVQAVIDPWGRRLAFAYDANARVAGIAAPDGQRVGYGYDGSGRLSLVTYADGATRQYLYENAAQALKLTGVIDEMNTRFASWSYDAQGRAEAASQAEGAHAATLSYGTGSTTVTDAHGRQRTLNFGAAHGKTIFRGHNAPCAACRGDAASKSVSSAGLIDNTTDFLGITTLFTWDTARRLPVSRTEAAGTPDQRVRGTEWHSAYRLPVRITEPGRVTSFTHDARGNVTSRTVTDTVSGAARTTRWTYTRDGLVETVQEPGGPTWHYEYDGLGNVSAWRDPEGHRTQLDYNAAGRVETRTDPGGLVTTYGYDTRGRLTSSKAGSETTTFAYHPTGRLRAVTLPSGVQLSYSYDRAQRLVAVHDSRGAVVRYTLDRMGNRVREDVQDASGNIVFTRLRSVNNLNRVTGESDDMGRGIEIGHDANGAPVSTTDALQRTTSHTLDALGRVTRTTFADLKHADQAWDALDQIRSVTDPMGVTTVYTRNALGELKAESSPDSGAVSHAHDASGNVIEKLDARRKKSTASYDLLGRPTQIVFEDQTQTFAYDADGNVQTMTDGSGQTSYSRDLHGRVLEKTQVTEGVTRRVGYTYAKGELASIQYPSGLQVFYQREGGRITRIDVQKPLLNAERTTFLSGLQYTALGQPKAWRWMSGDTASRQFDTSGRPTDSEIASWRYDAAGRIVGVTQQLWTVAGTLDKPILVQTPISWSAGYDDRNRLVSFSREGASSTFSYDANGNRTSSVETATSDVDLDATFASANSSQTVSRTHAIEETSNRLLGFTQSISGSTGAVTSESLSRVSYGIDAAGSLTSDGLRAFENDASGRLAKVIVSKDGEAAAVVYRHNALGQRVFKSDPVVEDTLPNEQRLGTDFVSWLKANFGWLFQRSKAALPGMAFVYDEAGNLLAEEDQASAMIRKTDYIWLPVDGGHVLVGLFRDGLFHAVHTDHLGTPRLVTDARNRPVWQWPYSAFGANRPVGMLERVTSGGSVRLKASAPLIEQNLRFPGQYADAESGLFHNWHRSYSPPNGRYGQVDPVGLQGGLNVYLYVDGSPFNFADPTGLEKLILFGSEDDILKSAAVGERDVSGRLTVYAHGNPSAIADSRSGGKNPLTPAQAAALVRNSGLWKPGMPITLKACEVAKGRDHFAQKLANELGVPVTGPDALLVPRPNVHGGVSLLPYSWYFMGFTGSPGQYKTSVPQR